MNPRLFQRCRGRGLRATVRRLRMSDDLILVNAQNRAVGRADKRKVHETGLLHRAFSIFLVDRSGQVVARHAPTTTPEALKKEIEALL